MLRKYVEKLIEKNGIERQSMKFWILYKKFVSVINDSKMIKYMWS